MRNVISRIGTACLLAMAAIGCGDEPVAVGREGSLEPLVAQANVTGSPGDREAIQQIVNTFDQTWAIDAAVYAGQYAGADWVGPNGARLSDPASIVALYASIFPLFAGTTRQSQIRRLTFLSGTIAVLDIDTRVTGPLPPFVTPWQPGIIRALEKNILLKRGSEWRIIQHQQVPVAPGVQ